MRVRRLVWLAAVAVVVPWLPVSPAMGSSVITVGPPFDWGASRASCRDSTPSSFVDRVHLCRANAEADAPTGRLAAELHVGSAPHGLPLLDGYGSAWGDLFDAYHLPAPARAVEYTITVALGDARAVRDPLGLPNVRAGAQVKAWASHDEVCQCSVSVTEWIVCVWDCRPGVDDDRSGETLVLRMRMQDEFGGLVPAGRVQLTVGIDAYGWSTGGWYDIDVDAVVQSVVAQPVP